MNNSKISFIYCVNDERQYAESAKSIDSLLVPEGFIIDKLAIAEAESIAGGYNYAMNHSDAKYKVYLHQDTLIINKNFIFDILALFQIYPKLGLLGMVGADTLPTNGIWWEARQKFGKVYESHTGTMELLAFEEVQSDYVQVAGIDGFMMITQYDLPWREDLLKGWHFYDLSQSAEFMKAGYEVGVPKQEDPWCIHDCGVIDVRNGFDDNRVIFLEEYSKQLFPLVSVMIPTYNRPRYFELALKSVLEQTYKNIEIIVCDDSTNDETQQLIQSYLQTYKHIRYYKNEQNLGPVQNDLKCMELAKGEYVNFLMDDDLFHSQKIERMMNYFLDYSDMNVSLVTSHRQLIDAHGNFLQDIRSTSKLFNENTIIDGYEFGSFMLRSVPFNYIGEPTTALFRKRDLEEPFGTFLGREYGCNVDMAAWIKLLSKGNIVYIAESLSYFRIHGEQQQHSEKMLVAGLLDYAHQILKAPQLGFFSNEAHYVQAIGNCLKYMSEIVNGISEEYRRNSDFRQIAFFQQLLTQKLQELLNKQPLVSVLIPAYNRPHYLELALQSVLNQTYKNIEIIVCDDSTNDEVQQMIQPYLETAANRIRYYKNESTLGLVMNFRKCFELSNGEYINYLLDDDLFHVNKIEKMMWYFLNDKQKEISLVTSYRQRIDVMGNELPDIEETKKIFVQDTMVDGIKFGEFICKKLMNVIGEPTTVLFRKESLKEPFGVFGGRQYKNNVDLASWMSLLSVGRMVYVSDALSYLRDHAEQVSKTAKASIEGYIDFAHQILEVPSHGFFKELQEEYKVAVESCLYHLKYAIGANKDNSQDYKDLMLNYLAVENKWFSLFG
ncbi:glycosyltransferase [Paenibacillus alkaliterrae]|uniref:glycosyltransferase n=1 Tax=Paenibacillus alkaliterrae TaxID=320909 RepID=UPI001F25EB29|nr:glycosyltransferase [Paenibacillus alkaliterrae]MCF2940393.1 glycosyltransferase [Paenibacillus alkaliterrae]